MMEFYSIEKKYSFRHKYEKSDTFTYFFPIEFEYGNPWLAFASKISNYCILLLLIKMCFMLTAEVFCGVKLFVPRQTENRTAD